MQKTALLSLARATSAEPVVSRSRDSSGRSVYFCDVITDSGVYRLDTQRSGPRRFRSLATAASFWVDHGFSSFRVEASRAVQSSLSL